MVAMTIPNCKILITKMNVAGAQLKGVMAPDLVWYDIYTVPRAAINNRFFLGFLQYQNTSPSLALPDLTERQAVSQPSGPESQSSQICGKIKYSKLQLL